MEMGARFKLNGDTPADHARLRSECAQFVEELQLNSPEMGVSVGLPAGAAAVLGKNRLVGLMIPNEYGGRGMDCLARLISIEETSRLSPEIGAFLQIAQLGAMALVDFGTDSQRAKWLPVLAAGERICTIAITEEESGSNFKASATRYRRTKDGALLNGEKWFIGNAPVASLHTVLARDEETGAFSFFLVDGNAEGVDSNRRHPTRGLRNFPFGAVRLTDVYVPIGNMIGGTGDGQKIAHHVIGRHGRLSLTGLALGIHQRIFDTVLNFARDRHLYGEPLINLPDVSARVFEIFSNLEQARSLAYRAAGIDRVGGQSGALLALAKRANSELSCKSALLGMEIYGGRANLEEFEVGQLMLDAAMTLAPSGTSDVLKKRILDDILGKRPIRWITH